MHLHNHTISEYVHAQREYEAALSCFLAAGDHIDSHYVDDTRQNLLVLQRTRDEMKIYEEHMKEAEQETDDETKLMLWRECCEEVLKMEQFADETPFIQFKNMAEKCHGNKSPIYAKSVHLYAEFLYNLYSASEDPMKLSLAKELCECAISVNRGNHDDLLLADALELYASVLSAIHDKANDEVFMIVMNE